MASSKEKKIYKIKLKVKVKLINNIMQKSVLCENNEEHGIEISCTRKG